MFPTIRTAFGGSGRSNSIAWLARRFSSLCNQADEKVFDKVVVITDRITLDRQLQDTINQFEHAIGVVESINKDSAQENLFGTIFFVKSEQLAIHGRGRPSHKQLYRRLSVDIRELRDRMGGLPRPAQANTVWKGIWHGEVHHSTALEGNTLAQREVGRLLEEGLAVGNRILREYLEVKGYAVAAECVYGHVAAPSKHPRTGPLTTLADVRMVHHKAMAPLWEVVSHRMPPIVNALAPSSTRHPKREARPKWAIAVRLNGYPERGYTA